MDDGIAFVRSLTTKFEESTLRLGSGARRWDESLETTRVQWDDGAGRDLLRRYLEPHQALLTDAAARFAAALEHHQCALTSATQAADAAERASVAIAHAGSAIQHARQQADLARSEAAEAQSDASRTRSMTQYVNARIAELGV